MLTTRTMSELRNTRVGSGLSQDATASAVGWSQSRLQRLESQGVTANLVELSELASVLGLELSVGLHPIGEPVRDKAQLAIGKRLDSELSRAWMITNEAPLPIPGDLRAWDKLLRLPNAEYRVGVDIESRIRDIQALTRRTRLRERDGGVDNILIVLADSATNRRLAPDLRAALGEAYACSPRMLLSGLRLGRPLVGSGVILI